MKTKSVIFGVAALAGAAVVAAPSVSEVSMSQPQGSKAVTITYALSGEDAVVTLDIQTNAVANAETGWVSIGGEAIWNAEGDVWKKVETGSRTITWRPDLTWKGPKGEGYRIEAGNARAVVTAWALNNTPDYMVVDISETAEKNSQRYYPAADFLPPSATVDSDTGAMQYQSGAITNNPLYKTTSIVMRKIMAKNIKWTMGSVAAWEGAYSRNATWEATRQVTLTNNYYIGVFEITQGQWASLGWTVTTDNDTYSGENKERHPVENVCISEVRFKARNSNGTGQGLTNDQAIEWAFPVAPQSDSWLGTLNTRTGLDFDLPSGEEWEFACRAGHGSNHWGDGSEMSISKTSDVWLDDNLTRLANYYRGSGADTAEVGSFAPNSWGLYDMHGNCSEIILQPYNVAGLWTDGDATNDQVQKRYYWVLGGNAGQDAVHCRPSSINGGIYYWENSRQKRCGFRVVCQAGLE